MIFGAIIPIREEVDIVFFRSMSGVGASSVQYEIVQHADAL